MSVMGFRDAYAEAVEVMVDGITLRVVSPGGLMLLKLVAWTERHHTQPKKDAADMAYLLRHFSTIVSVKTLFDQHFPAVEAAGFDIGLAASRVLGQKMAGITALDTGEYVLNLLENALKEKTDSALIREIAEHMAGASDERTYDLVQSVERGLREAVKPSNN